MSTLSSLATAEQAQLRLFLSQQNQSNNHQSINQSFFKTTPSLKPLDFEFSDLPSIDQSSNQSYDQPIDQSTKQNDFNRLLDQSFEQSFDQSINQYSVTGDFYSAAQSSVYQSFDKKIDEYQPIKQSTNYDYQPTNQSINQRKRGCEETVPDFGANKRQSTGQSINRFADEIWPDSADMLFPTGSYSSMNQSASQPTNQSFYQSDFNFNEIGLLDLSRLNSLGDQLLRNQSSSQLINQSIKRSTTGQSFDALLNPSINQSINFSPILSRQHSILDSPQPEVFNSGNNQAINQLINQSSNQSANQSIGSPHSTVSQQSVAPDNYIERLINHSIDYTQNHRSVSQSSSVVSIPPQQHQHQSIAVPPVSFSVAQSIAQPIIQPISQPSNEIIPKGEGHRRMKRRLTDKQRRAKIKDGLEHLRSLVHLHGDSSTDQASVVQSSINLIKQLVVESSSMKGELNRLKEEGVGISIQLQAQMHAAQTINQTMNQPINQPPRRPLQREQSNEQANNQSQAAQSLLSSLLNNQSDNQSTNQSTNQSNNQPMDGSMLSSYLLQTIQILSQLPISRMT